MDRETYQGSDDFPDLDEMARARFRSTSRGRTVVYALGAAVLVLVLVAGVAFANSVRVTTVTNNARSLHWTNSTLGTSALTRAGLVQAVTFAELYENAFVDPGDLDFAMDQVAIAVDELENLASIGEAHESYPELAAFLTRVQATVRTLQAGDVNSAKETISTSIESAYLELVASLDREQSAIQTAIEDNSQSGRTLNNWVVFILTLAVPGSAVAVYFVVARRQMKDLRERNQLEIEAERTISKAKDAFIAGLSHELRTPLTSIYGFAEIISDGGALGREGTEETARIIAGEAAEMTRMVDDLLAASRMESTGIEIELAPIWLDDVIESAVTPFEKTGVNVVWRPTNILIQADGARLRQILVNLISNAVRHGGPEIGIESTEEDGVVEVEVWDDGPGVPQEKTEVMFARFVHRGTAPLLTGSVGLGLAVASRLATLMGGNLRYQRLGARTYFLVTLPGATTTGEQRDATPVASRGVSR